MKGTKEVIDAEQRVHIFDSGRVELHKVNAEALLAILLLHYGYRRSPGAAGGSDDATIQHLLNLLGLLQLHSQVLLIVRKLHRRVLCLDSVLEHRGLPNIIVVLMENILILLK